MTLKTDVVGEEEEGAASSRVRRCDERENNPDGRT